jgi:glycosyltransferase involved in cell wall biosynthesis
MNPSMIDRSIAPRRILMYTAYFAPEFSGAALQALTLARQLRIRGHHVEFVTNRWPGLPDTAIIDGFTVQRLQPGRMRKHREFRLWFNLSCFVWQRRNDFDILHSHGAYFTNAFVGPLARALGLKSVVKASLAVDDMQDFDQPWVGTLHKAMLRQADACVAISADLATEFEQGNIERQRIHRLPNGVDTKRFCPVSDSQVEALRYRLKLPLGRPIALYLGVLDQRKNIRWLAEQWIANAGFGTGALLLATGPQAREDQDGELLDHLRELARQQPAHFALHEFNANAENYYQCANVLVLPSVKEGLPNVVLEAMACGLPCVAAQASGTSELIVEGRTGLTYAQGDVAGLGSAVRHCISPAGRVMGELGREIALEQYDIKTVAGAYASLYTAVTAQRRRVLYVENGIGYGGAVICLRHLVRNLDRTRFEPMVVTGLGGAMYQEIAREARWKQIPDRRVDVVSMKRSLVASHWPDRIPGLRWVANQVLARTDDVFNFLPSFLQTIWTVMRFRPHVIHVNNEPLCNRAAVLAGKLMRVPVVAHVRGDQQGSMLMHSLFRLPDYFVAVSRWVSESIGSLGVADSRRTYIYDGIELENLNVRADGAASRLRCGASQDTFLIGLVGLLIPWKGQRLFLDAAERLVDELPLARFAIVGGTPDECLYFEAELKQRIERSKLNGRVVFTGHVGDMDSVYNGLDVVLSASTSPEPLGTMIIEAMTMARAIVAPDHGGALEMIEDDQTGLLFKAGDADDLAAKIRRLHDEPDLARRLGQNARSKALATFGVEAHARQVEGVYERVLRTGLHPIQQAE